MEDIDFGVWRLENVKRALESQAKIRNFSQSLIRRQYLNICLLFTTHNYFRVRSPAYPETPRTSRPLTRHDESRRWQTDHEPTPEVIRSF